MSEIKKCFICKKPASDEFTILVDKDGKTEQETTYICKFHLAEYNALKKKKKRRGDFD